MIITICKVNGTRVQKALPPWNARLLGISPMQSPNMKTRTTPANAKTKGSGNQRSLQVESARPKRTRGPSDSLLAGTGFFAVLVTPVFAITFALRIVRVVYVCDGRLCTCYN